MLGTSGAALATTISYGVATSVSTVIFLRLTGLKFHELWRIQWSDIRAYFHLAAQVLEATAEVLRRTWRRVAPARAG